MIVPFDYVPKAAQGISQVNNTDGDAFYITVDGLRIEYELDNNSTVGAGRVRVPMGGSAAATVQNIVSVLTPLLQGKVYLVADGGFLDVVAVDSNISLEMGGVAGGSPGGGLVNSPQRVLPTMWVAIDRTVYAQDVARGYVRVYHQIDTVSYATVLLFTSSAVNILPWTGGPVFGTGYIDLQNGGASPFVAGNIFKLNILGDKNE